MRPGNLDWYCGLAKCDRDEEPCAAAFILETSFQHVSRDDAMLNTAKFKEIAISFKRRPCVHGFAVRHSCQGASLFFTSVYSKQIQLPMPRVCISALCFFKVAGVQELASRGRELLCARHDSADLVAGARHVYCFLRRPITAGQTWRNIIALQKHRKPHLNSSSKLWTNHTLDDYRRSARTYAIDQASFPHCDRAEAANRKNAHVSTNILAPQPPPAPTSKECPHVLRETERSHHANCACGRVYDHSRKTLAT